LKNKFKKLLTYLQLPLLYFFDFIFKYKIKKYIFVVGVDEIANCTFYFKKAFHNEAVSVNFTQNKFYQNNKYDYSLGIKNIYLRYLIKIFYGPYLLAKLANQSEVFVYFWSTGFCLERELDYKFLKYKNKKIVCIFVGDDVRSRKLTKEFFDEKEEDHFINYIINSKNENSVKRVAYLAEKYSDIIFSPRKVQLSYLKESIDFFMYMVDDNIFHKGSKLNLNDRIKVLHAPSNPTVKGTALVRAAVKKLKVEGYDFEYIELMNRPNSEVLANLESSHIVLNQFYAAMPGVFGIESMAKYNAVLMSPDYENLPDGSKNAWVRTKYWEIYDNLKYLLDNPSKIDEYAKNGYEFVKNNYTEEKVKEFYINTFYEHKIIDDKNIFKK